MPVVSAIVGHSTIKLTVDKYGHIQPVLHAGDMAAALGRATHEDDEASHEEPSGSDGGPSGGVGG
ncbi:MAG: hypothetical protein WCP28_00855 [Actinomycetes bacterium]